MSIQTVVERDCKLHHTGMELTECDDNKSGNEQHRNHEITTKTLTGGFCFREEMVRTVLRDVRMNIRERSK